MQPYFDDGDVRLYCADALEALRELPDQSVHMACTSPPFFGLRDYGTGTWEKAPCLYPLSDGRRCLECAACQPEPCDHAPSPRAEILYDNGQGGAYTSNNQNWAQTGKGVGRGIAGNVCGKCGATRTDSQIGLESSPDEWAARLVDVFREVRRVLRDDGTLFVECGDSYASQSASAYGNGDTAPLDSPERDSSSYHLCGGCLDALHEHRIARSDGLLVPTQDGDSRDPIQGHTESQLAHPPTSDSEGQTPTLLSSDATQDQRRSVDHAGELPPAVRVSTTAAGAPVLPSASCDGCGGSLGEPELRLGASALGVQVSAHTFRDRTPSTASSARPSADRIEDTASSRRAYTHSVPKPKDLIGQPWLLAFALRADGWYLRSCIIWAKPNAMPESVTDRPTTAHSYVFLFSKRPRYFYDAEALREPQDDPERGANGRRVGSLDERAEPGVRTGTMNNIDRGGAARAYNPAGKNARSVWQIPTEPNALAICRVCDAFWQGGAPREHCGQPVVQHFAAFPRELVRRMILAGSAEGDTVLDPFAGSGTTGLVARQQGRSAILIELNERYAAMCRARMSQLSLLA